MGEKQDPASLPRPVILDFVNGFSCRCIERHGHPRSVDVPAAAFKENFRGSLDSQKPGNQLAVFKLWW